MVQFGSRGVGEAGDPSLRLKNGSVQDDAPRKLMLKLHYYQNMGPRILFTRKALWEGSWALPACGLLVFRVDDQTAPRAFTFGLGVQVGFFP